MSENLLLVENIYKSYGHKKAIISFSTKIVKSNIYGLLGPNGAGKTTLLRLINNIYKPDKGFIFFDGEKLNNNNSKNIGYLPEERGLYNNMNIYDQILYLTRLKGIQKNKAKKNIDYWFNTLNIDNNIKYNNFLSLSKGIAQKIQFIIAVVHNPKLIILDEPFSGLDPLNTKLIINEIINLKKKGVSIILSTHEMNSVDKICDNIIFINKSKKILDSKMSLIKKKFNENNFKFILKINNKSLWDSLMKDNENIYNIIYKYDFCEFEILFKKKYSLKIILNKIFKIGDLISYRKKSLTLNDIFIKILKSNK